MNRNTTRIQTARLCLFVLILTAASAVAGERNKSVAEVRLKNGKHYRATVDRMTNEEVLWLRFATHDTVLLRPVAWSSVVGLATQDLTQIPAKRRWMVVQAIDLSAQNSATQAKTEDDSPLCKPTADDHVGQIRRLLGF